MVVELLVFLAIVLLGYVVYYYRRRWRLMVRRRSGAITYHVSARVPDGGDGSESKPFRTILQALQRSENVNVAVISVVVDGGVYWDNLTITRNTILTGKNHPILKCPILNSGGYDLTIRSLSISEARGRAITQTGGRLILEDVTIAGTRIVDGDPGSGRAVEIICYDRVAFASLRNVFISSNEGHAVLLIGDFTKAVLQNVGVEQNSVNPIAFENYHRRGEEQLIGAIEVADGAKLLMEQFTIMENDCISVLVRDGGLAHLRSGTVSGTKCFQDSFGYNLAAFRRGKLEVHNFATSSAENCGLAIDDGYLKLADGVVKDNRVGLCAISIPSEGFNYYTDACHGGESVRYINNQTRVDPMPPLPDPLSTATCPDLVPWE